MSYSITVNRADSRDETKYLIKPNPYEQIERIPGMSGSLLMVVSMLGLGVVTAPYAYTFAGSFGCPLLILMSLFCSWLAAVQLVSKLQKQIIQATVTGYKGEMSYERATGAYFSSPITRILLCDFPIVGLCMGAVASYIIIASNQLDGAMHMMQLESRPSSYALIGGVSFFMFFVSLLRTLDRFQNANKFCFALILICCGCVLYVAINTTPPPEALPVQGSFSGIISAVPLIITGFHCHANIPTLYAELKPEAKRNFPFVAFIAMAIGGGITFVMGYIPFTIFQSATKADLLRQLCDHGFSYPLVTAQALLGLVLAIKVPFLVSPVKSTFLSAFKMRAVDCSTVANVLSTGTALSLSCLIVVSTMGGDTLGYITRFFGATALELLMFVTPSLCLLKIPNRSMAEKLNAVFLICVGIGTGSYSTYSCISDYIKL